MAAGWGASASFDVFIPVCQVNADRSSGSLATVVEKLNEGLRAVTAIVNASFLMAILGLFMVVLVSRIEAKTPTGVAPPIAALMMLSMIPLMPNYLLPLHEWS
jgi:ABC-type proline/glycine betaine transport system permease subunit